MIELQLKILKELKLWLPLWTSWDVDTDMEPSHHLTEAASTNKDRQGLTRTTKDYQGPQDLCFVISILDLYIPVSCCAFHSRCWALWWRAKSSTTRFSLSLKLPMRLTLDRCQSGSRGDGLMLLLSAQGPNQIRFWRGRKCSTWQTSARSGLLVIWCHLSHHLLWTLWTFKICSLQPSWQSRFAPCVFCVFWSWFAGLAFCCWFHWFHLIFVDEVGRIDLSSLTRGQ